MIFKVIKFRNFKIDMLKAQTLRNLSESGKLTEDNITAILSGEYNKKLKKQIAFKLKPKIISKYFKPEQNKAEIEVVIDKALALYFESALQKEYAQK
jgi:ParB family chromosome partitioning protein